MTQISVMKAKAPVVPPPPPDYDRKVVCVYKKGEVRPEVTFEGKDWNRRYVEITYLAMLRGLRLFIKELREKLDKERANG